MEYYEAANFLFDLRRFQVNPGTETVRDLLARFDDPHEELSCVQIAGSNGKGSAAKMLESTLREAGLDVGLYTSPHFESVRERIRVDGRKITESAVSEFVAAAEPYLTERAAEGEPLTFFETVTAMALWRFARADVDVAVLEVGMGGERDATSVVDPVAAAVTNVTLEHADVLGDTVADIAESKAGVAPAGAPLVTAATGDTLDAVRGAAGGVRTVAPAGTQGDAAERRDVRVTYEGRVGLSEAAVSVEADDWSVEARLPLVGAHQATNAGVAAALARQIAGVDPETLARGLRGAHWPGRFEVMERRPLTVLDGAHNPDACETLASVLAEYDYEELHLVFGAMHEKDHPAMAAALPTPESVVTCRPNLDRAEDPAVLGRVFENAGVDAVRSAESVANALSSARDRAGPEDCVLVAGSLFCVTEARTTWTRVGIPKRVRSLPESREVLENANVTPAGVWRMRGKGVHRALKTRVERRQAQYLKEEMLSLGGECATAGLRRDGELTDVVLTGTLAQFKRLAAKLDGQPYGLGGLADGIRDRLAIGDDDRSADSDYPWEDGAAVMGILNVTPDSFHDGGEFFDAADAVERAEAMVEAGAELIDVGGESTRPGADRVPAVEEIERIVPVIEAIADLDALISVDTMKAEVGRAALDAGADVLNDVTGLADPEMRFLAAERDVPIVVMHSVDAPVDPENDVEYDDVVEDVIDELEERVLLAEKAGVPRERIIVDPGLGFGKSRTENFELLGRTGEFEALGCPILIGHSHKSMFELAGQENGDAPEATVAGTAMAVERGADIVRVHDVPENVAAVRVAEAADDPERFGGD